LKLLNSCGAERKVVEISFKENKASLQRKLRKMKNEWWSSLSFDVQNAYDRKDTKTFYKLISQAFGPQSSSVVPLKSKDGSVIIKDTDGIKNRWTEHFNEMNIPPDLEEVKATIKEINTGKAPGLDGIPVELLLHGGEQIASVIHSLILDIF
jgi:hypothetical protein